MHQEEAARLVGPAVRVATGLHGVEEVAEPGKATNVHAQTFCCHLLPRWLEVFALWPLSTLVWLLILGCQSCTCCYPLLGEAWCYRPSQIPYIHSLYVIWHTLKHTWCGLLCCCGWLVWPQPGVLIVTSYLPTPPFYIFDEDEDQAVLLTFKAYAAKKQGTSPPFSGRYRAVDGGGNSARYPFLGQGMRGYAMNEPYMLYAAALPDADELARALHFRTKFRPSPFGHNALTTWFANVAIHDFFRSATARDNKYTGGVDKVWVNLHSSYLDCQPLYGFNKETADGVRSWINGKLKAVAETRFDRSPVPESKVIVELLRREHNYVCDQLVQRYPQEFDTDEKLYQQARLILGGVYINIILRQYGDQMFGESAPDGRGFFELRQHYGVLPCCPDHRSVGNHLTFNFNLIYRWHTGIPAEWSASNTPPDETDDQLRQILKDMLNWAAGGFGPNNMPPDLFNRHVIVPAATIRQGRALGAPRLNDFRRRFSTPYKDFLDMCGDPDVAKLVARFYPTVEDVELSVGCQVERCMQGGWALGQTIGTAIVADAFNSIRQDRFYTTDFTPAVYTPWGYEHAKTTILADVINRHLRMDIDRNSMLSRLPSWRGPPEWSQVAGFDARGAPIVR